MLLAFLTGSICPSLPLSPVFSSSISFSISLFPSCSAPPFRHRHHHPSNHCLVPFAVSLILLLSLPWAFVRLPLWRVQRESGRPWTRLEQSDWEGERENLETRESRSEFIWKTSSLPLWETEGMRRRAYRNTDRQWGWKWLAPYPLF